MVEELDFKASISDFGLREEDKLFKEDENRQHNALLDWPQEHWESYVEGYRRAGDILVEHIKSVKGERETLVYPIVFSYRQYFELRLKGLIVSGQKALGKLPMKNLFQEHNLMKLWRECRQIFEKIFKRESEEKPEFLNRMEACLEEFNNLDSNSQTFRYPLDREGKSKLPSIKCIGLSNLAEVVTRMAKFLDATVYAIEDY